MEQRKGLTPIIAVVLLLLMTVAAAGLAYQFVTGTQSDVQEKVKSNVDSQLSASDYAFIIENVGKSGTGHAITIRNTGKAAITASDLSLYIDGASVAHGLTGSIAAGSTTTTAALGTFPSAGATSNIKITHKSGYQALHSCTNPAGTATYC